MTKDFPVQISLETNRQVLHLFFLLNLIGYDQENNPDGMHDLRKKARQLIHRDAKHELMKNMGIYLEKNHPYQLLAWILRKEYFTKELTYYYPQAEIDHYEEFSVSFSKFIEEYGEMLPWKDVKYFYQIEKQKLPKIKNDLAQLVTLLGLESVDIDFGRLVLTPNFLDAFQRGYSFRIQDVAYIVYGPEIENTGNLLYLIRHEFLHLVITPIVHNMLAEFDQNQVEISDNLKGSGYDTMDTVVSEYIIRVLNIYLSDFSEEERERMFRKEEYRGFTHIREVYKRLTGTNEDKKLVAEIKEVITYTSRLSEKGDR